MQVTASKSYLLLECPYPFSDAIEKPRDTAGEATRYGSAFHQTIAVRLNGGDWQSQAAASAKWWSVNEGELLSHVEKACVELLPWLEGENPFGIAFSKQQQIVEKSYWLDPAKWLYPWDHIDGSDLRKLEQAASPSHFVATGECSLDEEGHEYHGHPAGSIPGTLDYLSQLQTTAQPGSYNYGYDNLVLDWKTGQGDFSQPGENPQLLTLAAMTGARIVGIGHFPRQGLPMIYADRVTDEDVSRHVERLAAQLQLVGNGSMRPGEWCKYCPAREVCPAKQGEMIQAATAIIPAAGAALRQATSTAIVGDKVGELKVLSREVRKWLDMVDSHIRAVVSENPGEIYRQPDGKLLQMVPQQRERLSKRGILEALGPIEGGKLLQELRDKGALPTVTEMHLKAIDDD